MGNSHESKRRNHFHATSIMCSPRTAISKGHVIRAPTTDILEDEAMSIENAKWKTGIQTARI
jgi:hypothetical protein